jgi:thermopsin
VNPDPTISIIISRNNTDVGIPIFLNANAQGGTPPYTETWYINGMLVSNDGVLNYTFSSSGVYNVSLKITDSVNFTVEKSVMVEVHKDPTLIVSTNKTETDQGIPIELNVTGNYGISPYLVKVYINGTIINTSIINTGVKLPLNLPSGVYLVRVTLTDSVGYQVSKGIILKFNKDPILVVSNVTQGNFFVTITSMTLSGEGSEGTPPYTYTVYVNGNEYYTGSDLSLNVPLNLGENNITVVMKDSLGMTVTRTILVYSSYNWINILIVVALIVIIPVISIIFLKKRRN